MKQPNGGEFCALSVYGSGQIQPKTAIQAIKTLMACFPQTDKQVFDSFFELAKKDNKTDDWLNDCVEYALRNHRFPSITINELISFDKRYKVYSYRQMVELVNSGLPAFTMYPNQLKINGVVYWHNNEVITNNQFQTC